MNPLGGMSSGGPPSIKEQIDKLFERLTPVVGSLSHLHTSLNKLRDNLGRMAELSARANASLLFLVGLPRIFRSDLWHMVAYGAGPQSKMGRNLAYMTKGATEKFGSPTYFAGMSRGPSEKEGMNMVEALQSEMKKGAAMMKDFITTIQAEVEKGLNRFDDSAKKGPLDDEKAKKVAEGHPAGKEASELVKEQKAEDEQHTKLRKKRAGYQEALGVVRQRTKVIEEITQGNTVDLPPSQKRWLEKESLLKSKIADIDAIVGKGKKPFPTFQTEDSIQGPEQGFVYGKNSPLDQGRIQFREKANQLGRVLGMDLDEVGRTDFEQAADDPGNWMKLKKPKYGWAKHYQNDPNLTRTQKWSKFWEEMKQPTIGAGGKQLVGGQISNFITGGLESFGKGLRGASIGLQKYILEQAKATKSPFFRSLLLGTNQLLRGRGNILENMQALGGKAAMPTLYGAATVGSLLSAASPDAFQTLTGSVHLLAIALGRNLIPMTMFAAYNIQKFALTVGKWDAPALKVIGSLSMLGVATGIVVTVLGLLSGAFLKIIGVLNFFGAGLTRTSISTGLLTAGLFALGAAVFYATLSSRQSQQERKQALNDMLGAKDSVGKGNVLPHIKEEFDEKLRQIYEKETDPEKRKQALLDYKNRAEELEQKEKEKLGQFMKFTSSGVMGYKAGIEEFLGNLPLGIGPAVMQAQGGLGITDKDPMYSLYSKLQQQGMTPVQMQKFLMKGTEEMSQRVELADREWKKLNGQKVDLTQEEQQKKEQLGTSMLLALSSVKSTPQYSSIEEAHKRTQIQALGDDPLTQKIEQWKMESLDYMLKIVGVLEKDSDTLTQFLNMLRM